MKRLIGRKFDSDEVRKSVSVSSYHIVASENGETDEACAVREVEEETGLRCDLGIELPTIRYRDRKDRLKEVRYWAMEPLSGSLQEGNEEVDEVRWVAPAQALAVLSYVHDREVVAAWVAECRT